MSKFFGHLKTVLRHKWYVFQFCCKAGMPIRGILHDLSKFSPTEFKESVEYYTDGTVSPINTCKAKNGVSYAWMHHKGRNPHHYEFWQDNFDQGGIPVQMPYRYALEMVCDYLGAGKAYMKDKFTYEKEHNWWKSKRSSIAIHPQTRRFIDIIFMIMMTENSLDCLKPERSKAIYVIAEEEYKKENK